MKRMISIFVLILGFAFTGLMAQPKMELENGGKVDWGRVKPKDNPLKDTMKIYNTGNKVLKILEVKPGCSCTTAPLDKDEIEPGDHAELKITMNIGDHEGTAHKVIKIKTNEADSSYRYIDLQAVVIPSISFFPKKVINMGMIKMGTDNIGKVVMTNTTDKDITITNVTSTNTISTNIKDNLVIPAHKDIELEAHVVPTQTGNYIGEIILKTNDPDTPEVKVYASGQVLP